jgi:hypothetical protein
MAVVPSKARAPKDGKGKAARAWKSIASGAAFCAHNAAPGTSSSVGRWATGQTPRRCPQAQAAAVAAAGSWQQKQKQEQELAEAAAVLAAAAAAAAAEEAQGQTQSFYLLPAARSQKPEASRTSGE